MSGAVSTMHSVHSWLILTDAGSSRRRVNNLLLAVLPDTNVRLLVLVLLGDERRDVRLETTGTNTHDDETNGEDGNRCAGLGDDLGNGREDEENVTDDGDDVGILDGEVTAPVLISKPRATERSDVRPELVDCALLDGGVVSVRESHTHGQAGGSSLAHTKRTRTRLFEEPCTSLGTGRKVLLDEVDDCILLGAALRGDRSQDVQTALVP